MSLNSTDWNPMRDDFNADTNTYDYDADDPAAAIYGYVGKDYEHVCQIYNKHGKCFKGDACRKEHIRLDPSGYTTDKQLVHLHAFNRFPLPSINETIPIQITAILKINLFYCLKKTNESERTNEETLNTLVNYMNQNENIRQMKKMVVAPSVGEIVIGKFSVDDSWCRAKVLTSEPEKNEYSVFFVDYGNTERLPLSQIREMENRYLHLPFQALKCSLYGVDDNKDLPEELGSQFLDEITDGKNLKIKVISHFPGENNHLLVKLFDENDCDLGNRLVFNNYASERNEFIIDEDSDFIPG